MTPPIGVARVRREGPASLVLETEDGGHSRRVTVEPRVGGGWEVHAPDGSPGRRLERRAEGPGFRLTEGGSGPHAESYGVEVGGQAADLRYFLLPDGRLYRLVPHGPREVGCEVRGWETPGSYLTARPDGGGWILEASPAGARLPGLSTLCLLLAIELVDSDEPLAQRASDGA